MNRPTSNNEEENRLPASSGEATFLSDIQAAGTVNNGETVVNPAIIKPTSPKFDPSKTVLPSSSSDPSSSFTFDASAPADSQSPRTPQAPIASTSTDAAADKSSLGTAPTLVGHLQINAQQAPFPGHRTDDAKAQDPKTEKTFLSSQNIDPVGATIIGAPVPQDGEDFFDTLKDSDVDPKSSLRGYVVGDYQILSELGRGGMGVVYKAKHRKLNRVVALKMILAGKHSGNEALGRFIAEAQAVAKLQHPGIVQIFDIGEHEGLPYFSLEYVEGNDLHKDLKGLPRDPKRSAEMVEQLSLAMQYAHDHKLLHRDLKPANILLTKDGQPKISDFGLAKNVDAESSGATNDGTIMGSPSYMPPEQARGENSSMTPRSDLYSLGAILYQMLTARPPFVAERPLDTVLQVINNEPVAPRDLQPGVPVDLETICMKAMQKDPISRYASCAELAADLRRFINDEPILARPVSRLERLVRWCKRNPRVAIPSGLASLFIFITAVVSTWAWSTTSALAAGLADEKKNVEEERDRVQKERDEAQRQKILANEAQLQAEKNEEIARKQALLALGNIQTFLTEIDDNLRHKPGTTDLRISLFQVIEKEWEKLDVGLTGGLRGEAIPTLMTVRYKLAKAWVDLGKLQEADAQFAKLYSSGKERMQIKNRNDATRFNQSQIALEWSRVRTNLTGNPTEGDALREESLALIRDVIANPVTEADPEVERKKPKPFQLREILYNALQQVGNDMNRRREFAKAEAAFREATEVTAQLLTEIENNAPWFTELPGETRPKVHTAYRQLNRMSQAGLGNIFFRTGRTDEAIALSDRVIENSREDLAKSPDNHEGKHQLRSQLTSYGRSMVLANRLDAAAHLLNDAVSISEELHALEPKVVDHMSRLGSALYYLGVVRDEQKLPEEALAFFERSRSIRTLAVASEPTTDKKMELMLSEARLANVEAARKLIDELGSLNVKNGELHFDRARALAQLARRAEGDQQTSLRNESLQVLKLAVADGFLDSSRIRSEPDLEPLHGMDQFEAVLTDLESTKSTPAQ